MNRHLSEDQIARCIVSQATQEELLHSRDCPECAARLNHFGDAIFRFQRVIDERVDNRIALHPSVAVSRPVGGGFRLQRWALVAAVATVLVVLPFIREGSQPEQFPQPLSVETDADAVMNRVNLHLARSVPSPMQPLLLGLPKYESVVESGGRP